MNEITPLTLAVKTFTDLRIISPKAFLSMVHDFHNESRSRDEDMDGLVDAMALYGARKYFTGKYAKFPENSKYNCRGLTLPIIRVRYQNKIRKNWVCELSLEGTEFENKDGRNRKYAVIDSDEFEVVNNPDNNEETT